MKQSMKITVIIPVHNSEKYLRECMRSVLSQTLQDIEILCIDGESTDSSFEIIEEFCKRDSRISFIYDPNTSYGHKINVGIDKAQGKYVSILESDDKLSPGMLERLYDIAEKYEPDIVDADYYGFFLYKGKEIQVGLRKYSNPEIYDRYISGSATPVQNMAYSGIWTGIYKKAFLMGKNIRLNESNGASYQDTSFIFLTSILAETSYHLSEPLYQYRIDNTGSSVKDDKKIFEVIGELDFLKHDLKKRNIQGMDIWKMYYRRKYSAFYWNYCRLSADSRDLFLEKYLEELRGDIKHGHIKRDTLDNSFYDFTFLLVDNKDMFHNVVVKKDNKIPIMRIFDILGKLDDRDLVVFGAGILGSRLISILQQCEKRICGLCDNSKSLHGIRRYGLEVISVKEAVTKFPDALFLIANYQHGGKMKSQLFEEGIDESNIIVFT